LFNFYFYKILIVIIIYNINITDTTPIYNITHIYLLINNIILLPLIKMTKICFFEKEFVIFELMRCIDVTNLLNSTNLLKNIFSYNYS
jgi:hypothetical protein